MAASRCWQVCRVISITAGRQFQTPVGSSKFFEHIVVCLEQARIGGVLCQQP